MEMHTLPPFPRPDISNLCKSVVDLLRRVSVLSGSDGGVNDGSKKRKQFVDLNQLNYLCFASVWLY